MTMMITTQIAWMRRHLWVLSAPVFVVGSPTISGCHSVAPNPVIQSVTVEKIPSDVGVSTFRLNANTDILSIPVRPGNALYYFNWSTTHGEFLGEDGQPLPFEPESIDGQPVRQTKISGGLQGVRWRFK